MRTLKFRQPMFTNAGKFNGFHFWGWMSEGNFVSPLSMGHNVNGVFGDQLTGLQDKNGVDIYEGDIINSPDWKPQNYEVVFCDGAFGFKMPDNQYVNDAYYMFDFEIVGNIHDTPDLLTN